MWALLRPVLGRIRRFISFRNGTSTAAILLWALLQWAGTADIFSRFVLAGVLVLLLVGGAALLFAGIKDLLKGVLTKASDRISPEEAKERGLAGERIVFVDARDSKAWSESAEIIPGAIRVPADAVEGHIDEVNKDSTVIAYCTSPNEGSSARVAQILRSKGYRAFALRGGFDAWVASEYPLESKSKAA